MSNNINKQERRGKNKENNNKKKKNPRIGHAFAVNQSHAFHGEWKSGEHLPVALYARFPSTLSSTWDTLGLSYLPPAR